MTEDLVAMLQAQGVEPEKLLQELIAERDRRLNENRLKNYKPYPRQMEFHALGATKRERLFMAANQVGKTLAGSAEAAIHLTGRYPAWWSGAKFSHPITAWAGGETREATRDGLQRLLLGRGGASEDTDISALGTGMIPKDALLSVLPAPGVPGGISVVRIKNQFGTPSTLIFKSYDMGRQKWQSDTVDLVIFDEEPPMEIYTEGLTRTNAIPDGRVYLTFTPLLGRSEVVMRFDDKDHPDRGITNMTLDDALHYTQEQKDRIIASYPAWERDARTKGIPTLGSGAIYPVTEELITEEGQKIPDYWAKIVGMDFGWDHPTTAAWLAWDRDADVVHVYDVYKLSLATPVIHGAAIKAKGARIPVAWPHDGLQHDKGSGEQLAELYRKQGVAMLPERSQFPDDRGHSPEAGVIEILDRMQTGRFKVARHLRDFFDEFRNYHRKEGKIVKQYDDILDAVRIGMMSLRYARAVGPRPSDPYRRQTSPSSTSYMAA